MRKVIRDGGKDTNLGIEDCKDIWHRLEIMTLEYRELLRKSLAHKDDDTFEKLLKELGITPRPYKVDIKKVNLDLGVIDCTTSLLESWKLRGKKKARDTFIRALGKFGIVPSGETEEMYNDIVNSWDSKDKATFKALVEKIGWYVVYKEMGKFKAGKISWQERFESFKKRFKESIDREGPRKIPVFQTDFATFVPYLIMGFLGISLFYSVKMGINPLSHLLQVIPSFISGYVWIILGAIMLVGIGLHYLTRYVKNFGRCTQKEKGSQDIRLKEKGSWTVFDHRLLNIGAVLLRTLFFTGILIISGILQFKGNLVVGTGMINLVVGTLALTEVFLGVISLIGNILDTLGKRKWGRIFAHRKSLIGVTLKYFLRPPFSPGSARAIGSYHLLNFAFLGLGIWVGVNVVEWFSNLYLGNLANFAQLLIGGALFTLVLYAMHYGIWQALTGVASFGVTFPIHLLVIVTACLGAWFGFPGYVYILPLSILLVKVDRKSVV